MILYKVKYKKRFIWHTLRKCKGDGIVENNSSRFFILEDETRIEIPCTYIFKFSPERFYLIKEKMSNEIGQEVRIDKR